MTADEMLCRWAERKYSLVKVDHVEIVTDEGWAGTDETPGDPPSFAVRISRPDGPSLYYADLETVPSLIREIVEFALGKI